MEMGCEAGLLTSLASGLDAGLTAAATGLTDVAPGLTAALTDVCTTDVDEPVVESVSDAAVSADAAGGLVTAVVAEVAVSASCEKPKSFRRW